MSHMKSLLATCALATALPSFALCDDGYLRCDGGLVSSQSSVSELLQKCGSPSSKEVTNQDVRNERGVVIGTARIETWRYERGARAPAMVVTVADGKIQSLEDGR
jgi:hypothetical protein